MDSIHNRFPRLDVLFSPNTWRVWIPLSGVRYTGSFGYEKTSVRTGCSLRVIEDSMRLWNIAIGSVSCECVRDTGSFSYEKTTFGCSL
ncbi:hypothetical protein MtrunA17_Chr5g0394821 [Medicago truncatula]|uniref:Uncharacterized protein n=1 Tax=Medicago truncatula TaxID=3880 RepID=A0A396HJ43_MEDTR|nr:hypothetical protein MtrunA17_Chr5g0394821 [Medicago truncatula]